MAPAGARRPQVPLRWLGEFHEKASALLWATRLSAWALPAATAATSRVSTMPMRPSTAEQPKLLVRAIAGPACGGSGSRHTLFLSGVQPILEAASPFSIWAWPSRRAIGESR
jgi:hypothetical protein